MNVHVVDVRETADLAEPPHIESVRNPNRHSILVNPVPPDPDKHKIRKLKRAVKKRGNKHRRALLKKTLDENPEGAAEVAEDLGRFRSDTLNGIDRDSTRRRE